MLSPRSGTRRGSDAGFALPTVLVASIVMLVVLLSAVSLTSSTRVALDEQYYIKLAQEAAEAGQARAEACLEEANYTAADAWDDTPRLRPDTDCKGEDLAGGNRYVLQNGNIRTTFVVWAPVVGSSSSATVTVVGTTELLRTSTQSVYQKYDHTLVRQSRYIASPKIAGGGGWQGSRHIAAVLSTSQKLYGFGANDSGQINELISQTSIVAPMSIGLPTGVTSVVDLVTGGQGASMICIMANTSHVWCRGAPGGGEPNALMPTTTGWHRFGLPGYGTPSEVKAVSMSLSGYGPDSMCVLGTDGQGYCAGENFDGSLGINDPSYRILKIGSPERFRLDIPAPGQTLRKIHTESNITCGITVTNPTTQTNSMYCAGRNNRGEIGGPGVTTYAAPIRYPIPGARSIDDVAITYHTSDGEPVVHALATDGTIWSSGSYKFGDLGNGTTTGSTGTSQTPSLFTHAEKQYATGSEFWNGGHSNRCIDNAGNGSTNGNIIQLYDCNSSPAQYWVYGTNKQLTNLGTGKCLDVPGNGWDAANNRFTEGLALQLYDCNGSPAQQFNLVGGNTIVHIASGFCADTRDARVDNGTRIQTWPCHGGGPQNFTTWNNAINGWRGMVVGMNHFCAIREDGLSGMWCAGRNAHGQLLNDATNLGGGQHFDGCTNAPATGHSIFNVNLPPNEEVDYTKLDSEWNRQYNSTMIITKSGKVFGAGRNQFGKLGSNKVGDSAFDYRECETQQFQLPAGVTAVALSARDEFTTYVLGSNGRIYAAGRNNLGQLGNGSSTTSATPTPVEVRIPRQAFVY